MTGAEGTLHDFVRPFIEGYEFDSDDCHHVPTADERALLEDAMLGFLDQYTETHIPISSQPVRDKVGCDRPAFSETDADSSERRAPSPSVEQAARAMVAAWDDDPDSEAVCEARNVLVRALSSPAQPQRASGEVGR